MPQDDPNAIEIRSEEVQEILSHIPNWIIRWGITAILLTVLALLISSWFIKYPDKIDARVTVTTQSPPAKIMARNTGNLNLLKEDKQWVEKGTLLGIIENPARTEDILYLKKALQSFEPRPSTASGGPKLVARNDLELGALQNSFLNFQKSIIEYNRFSQLAFHRQQINALEINIRQRKMRKKQLEKQQALAQNVIVLDERKFANDSLLFVQGAATRIEMDNSKAALLRSKRELQSLNTSMIDNDIQMANLQRDISETKLREIENEDQLSTTLDESFDQLKSELSTWEQQYFLTTPVSGNITFSKYWSDNQFVNTGDEVMTIIPKSEDIFGQVLTPIAGSGKVEVGQRVNIKLDNYPSNEYGMVVGEVASISSIPRDNMYTIRVTFPDGLLSSYKKELDFKQEMQGNASIITKELRLIERVFNQVRSLVDNAS